MDSLTTATLEASWSRPDSTTRAAHNGVDVAHSLCEPLNAEHDLRILLALRRRHEEPPELCVEDTLLEASQMQGDAEELAKEQRSVRHQHAVFVGQTRLGTAPSPQESLSMPPHSSATPSTSTAPEKVAALLSEEDRQRPVRKQAMCSGHVPRSSLRERLFCSFRTIPEDKRVVVILSQPRNVRELVDENSVVQEITVLMLSPAHRPSSQAGRQTVSA